MDRIYVCHTYYHVLIATIKELNMPSGERGKATLLLSLMSTDFESLKDRVEESGVFASVLCFDEKRDINFPELMELKKDKGNIVFNMLARMRYTHKFAKLQEVYVPVDFREYKDIYVFCDGDPIGVYLNQKRIHYHAVEDGLNTLRPYVQAKFDNRGCFNLKKFFSMKLNLIFMCDGYSKYCLDMEVNDISVINDSFDKYVEVPRSDMYDALTVESKETLGKIFIKDYETFTNQINQSKGKKCVLILTEPLCSLDVRHRIFEDLIDEYSKKGIVVVLKPHPRDELDYQKDFPNVLSFDRTVPMEMFRILSDVKFSKVVSVYTQLDDIDFAEEKIYLGHDFMDKYEDPSVHRKEELVRGM